MNELQKGATKNYKKKLIILIFIIVFILACAGVAIFANSKITLKNEVASDSNSNLQNIENIANATQNTLVVDVSENKTTNIVENNEVNNKNLEFELPINGATGYAPTKINLLESAKKDAEILTTISAGNAFTIISEDGNYLYAQYDGKLGFLDSTLCMINLPDIIPSIVYDNTNSYSSIFKSSGYNLDGITGKQLYDASSYNNRFSEEEYSMPVIYQMAKKIYQAQKMALENNQSLKIYETFRPYEVQKKVSTTLKSLANSNETVKKGINNGGWGEGWFIAQSRSNHQLGVAMDVSLVNINLTEKRKMGNYAYTIVTDYTECSMPSNMHELSTKAVAFSKPVSSKNDRNAWKNVSLAKNMTEGAKQLQKYCTTAGLTPLASEWWHFDDLDAKAAITNKGVNGEYYLKDNVSKVAE